MNTPSSRPWEISWGHWRRRKRSIQISMTPSPCNECWTRYCDRLMPRVGFPWTGNTESVFRPATHHCARPDSGLLGFGHETITYSAHCEQMARVGWVIFNVTPQPDDEVIDSTSVGVFFQSPNFLKNGFARDYASIVADQMSQ